MAEISAPFAGRSYLIRAGHRRAQHCPRVASPPPSPAPRARQLRGGPTQLTAEPPAQPAPLGRAGSERIPGPAPPGPSSASSAEAGTLRCPGPELTQGRAPPEPNCAWAASGAQLRQGSARGRPRPECTPQGLGVAIVLSRAFSPSFGPR
ncbi:unnamed protein product, partial [Prorocentrum cordatum]